MDKGFAHNASYVSASILVVDSANSIRRRYSIAAIVGVRTRNKKENNKRTEKQHSARLMSTRDIEFKDCGICQDRSVICCGNNCAIAGRWVIPSNNITC